MTLNASAGGGSSFTGSISAIFGKQLTSYADAIKQVRCHIGHVTHFVRCTFAFDAAQRVPSSRGALAPEKELHLATIVATGGGRIGLAVL
jgi:hypothetical protein